MERIFWVYILASRRDGALYVGVTSNLAQRLSQHREGRGSRHAARYRIRRLVFAEPFPTALEAIAFEKRLKKWHRDWKVAVIEQRNPDWLDLSTQFFP